MFGISMPEMILILAVALIVIGPKKLPDLAKSLGQALGEFKKATRELKDAIEIESDLATVRDTVDDVKHHFTTDDKPVDDITDTPNNSTDPSIFPDKEIDNPDDIKQKSPEGSFKDD